MSHKQMGSLRQGHLRDLPEFKRWEESPDCSLLGDNEDTVKSSVKWERDVSTSNPYLMHREPGIDFCVKHEEDTNVSGTLQTISKGSLSQTTIDCIILLLQGCHPKGSGKCFSAINQNDRVSMETTAERRRHF